MKLRFLLVTVLKNEIFANDINALLKMGGGGVVNRNGLLTLNYQLLKVLENKLV